MKFIQGQHLWHYWGLTFEAKRVRCGVALETMRKPCRLLKFVGASKGWHGGCLWLWRIGFGVEWKSFP